MCGIAGFVGGWSFEDLRTMTRSLYHRGPDGEGLWHDPDFSVYLGHRRLAVIDPRDGYQPMWTQDGSIGIVFNGEIYNHHELRIELIRSGHKFTTDHSDTEVLLHGYHAWGQQVTEHLNGMWAFAIYDKRRKLIFCSRDRFGEKPFYYTLQNGKFAFASELTALKQLPGLSLVASKKALHKYYGYGYIPAPHTYYENIYKLQPGHSLVHDIEGGRTTVSRYWEFILEPDEARPAGYEDQCAEEIRELLDQSVRRRLISDVPIGVFLSGGIDSSAITIMATRQRGPDELKTFSIGFQEDSFDETPYAKVVADIAKSCHWTETLTLQDAIQLIPEVIRLLDEPMGDSSLISTYLLCKLASRQVTVALGGDGSDELFAGYAPFRALRWSRCYQSFMPKSLHKAIRYAVSFLPASSRYMSLDFKIKRALGGMSYPPNLWNPAWMSSLEEHEFTEFFNEPIALDEVFSEAIELWEANETLDEVDRTLQFYTRLYLANDILTKTDRASMMNSIEVRSPFLDNALVDRIRTIPSCLKYKNGVTKYILKKALEPWLPANIIYRSKQGFAVPLAKWFKKGDMRIICSYEEAVLNSTFISRALEEHRFSKKNYALFLWYLTVHQNL